MTDPTVDPFQQEQPLQGTPEGAATPTPGAQPDPKAAQPQIDPELQALKDQFKKEIESAQFHSRRYQSMADKAASVFGPEPQQAAQPQTPADAAFQATYEGLIKKGFKPQDAQDWAAAQAQGVQAAIGPVLAQLHAAQAQQALPMAIQQAAADPVVQMVLNDPQAYQHMNQIIQSNASQGFAPTKEMVQNAAYMAWGPRYAQQGHAPQATAQPVPQMPMAPVQFSGTTFNAPGGWNIRQPQSPTLSPADQNADAHLASYVDKMKAQNKR